MFPPKTLPTLLTVLTGFNTIHAAALPTEYEPISAVPNIPYPWRRSSHSNSDEVTSEPLSAMPHIPYPWLRSAHYNAEPVEPYDSADLNPAILPRDSDTTYEPISAIPHIPYPWNRSPHSPTDLAPRDEPHSGNTFAHPHWYLLTCLGNTVNWMVENCAGYGYNCSDTGVLEHAKATVEYTLCETECKCELPEPYQTCFEEKGGRRCISNKVEDGSDAAGA